MDRYLRLFENHEDYEDYASGGTMLRPNVSYCEDVKDVHYNPWVETKLIVTYNIQDASTPTQLYYYVEEATIVGANMFSKVEIDGTEVSVSDLDATSGTCELSSGEHTVKYTLINPTAIGVIDIQTMEYCALFTGCDSITNVIIPNSVTNVGLGTFQYCNNLSSVTIPNGVIYIDSVSFYNCSSLTNVIIPNSVTSIGDNAFNRCRGLTSINIPNGVTTIGEMAFESCTGLQNVTIGSAITSIGKRAFNGCSGLTSITVLATTPPTLGENAFASTNNCPIYIPSESIESYMSSWAWDVATSRLCPI